MWKGFFKVVAQFWRLAEGLQTNSTAIREMREEIRELWRAVDRLGYEGRRTEENDAHEREKLLLRVHNELLQFERRLLPPPRKK